MQTTTKCPPSVEILFLRHSQARVVKPSNKAFVTGYSELTGAPDLSRQLQDVDVIARHAKYWSKH